MRESITFRLYLRLMEFVKRSLSDREHIDKMVEEMNHDVITLEQGGDVGI